MDIKVLLVDNDKNIREILRYGLNTKGIFNIEEASSGMEGLVKAIGLKPDIIILDVTMPIMDGIQTYKKLKEKPETKEIPIILLTAQLYEEIAQKIPIAPLEYMDKPYDIEELYSKIIILTKER